MIAARVFAKRFRHVLGIIRATMGEIFEESAYDRFLDRHGVKSSREAYAQFLRESEGSRGRRVRCC